MPTWLIAVGGTAIALVLLIASVRGVFDDVRKSGAAEVRSSMQGETLQKLDAGAAAKERANEEVRRTPYNDLVDGMR